MSSAAPPRGAPAPDAPLWAVFARFLGPMLLSNILQSLSGTLNNVYIGQMLGVRSMAAVAGFFPVLFFLISFSIGLGAGASVLIGQAWGARDTARAKAVAGTTLGAGIALGLFAAVFGGTLTRPLLVALGTPADILPEATAYARIMLIAMPGLFVFLLATAMLRGVGDTVTPLLTLGISSGVGLLLTPALIRGWGGLPQLGVTSAAWATVLGFLLSTAWMAWRLRRRRSPLAPDAELLRHMRIDPRILKQVLRIGIPTGVQMVTIALAEVALLWMVNGFGSEATAAYGAVNQVVAYVQFPAISIAITASVLGAQSIGAGRPERLGAITRTGLWMNLVLTGSLVLLGYLFSRRLMGFFITSPQVIDLAQGLLHIMLWSSIIFGMASVVAGVMRASGTVLVPTGIAIFCIAAVEVPVAWVLSRHMGVDGIWIGYPAAFTAMLVLQSAYYRLVWRKKRLKRIA
ncbi:MATE family efflux transporter [Xylophilus sp. ASV27]|uniref:MATE family efflux transporter n=1 Tax=Xylophilus sp. ASV27 TaxID=2795129 RepID=UPI0018EA6624